MQVKHSQLKCILRPSAVALRDCLTAAGTHVDRLQLSKAVCERRPTLSGLRSSKRYTNTLMNSTETSVQRYCQRIVSRDNESWSLQVPIPERSSPCVGQECTVPTAWPRYENYRCAGGDG